MCAKGNPKFSCPPITFPSNKISLMKQSDSREKLFDSSLKTVNVSVNTELSMSCSFNSKKEVNDYFYFYGDGDGDDDVFHKVISVDNLAYSTSYNDEDDDNGERHAGLKPCETGLETCDVLKPQDMEMNPLKSVFRVLLTREILVLIT